MGRPRGNIKRQGNLFVAALPIAVGSTKRKQFSDPNEVAVKRWYTAGEAALAAGRPLPDPTPYRTRARATTVTLRSTDWWVSTKTERGHSFAKVAHAWAIQRYTTLRRAQPERHGAMLTMIDREIIPWFASRNVTLVEGIENQLTAEFAAYLAGQRPTPPKTVPMPWPKLSSDSELTLAQARALPGLSASTITHWRRNGLLPGYYLGSDRRVRIPVSELRAARTKQLQRRLRVGLALTTSSAKLAALRQILDFAQANGVPLAGDPMRGITAVAPDPRVALTQCKAPKRHLAMEQSYSIATGLSVVQQLVFWLTRILGMRIGETFGPQVGDVVDFGEKRGGAIVLERQGGRRFLLRGDDGILTTTATKAKLKNPQSVRAISIPWQMMEMIRVVIDAFHTDPTTGQVDLQARLVPGLHNSSSSGQQAHRAALNCAVAAAGIDEDTYGRITPHRQRASLITDLSRAGVPEVLARRFVGHLAGHDEHSRAYLFDPAHLSTDAAEAWQPLVTVLEQLIDTKLGGTLMVPTPHQDFFGATNPLNSRRDYIFATLAAAGWYVEPHTEDAEPLVGTLKVAAALGIAESTANRWMRTRQVPARHVHRDGREVWGMRQADLDAEVARRRQRPAIEQLAKELGVTYHQLYTRMQMNGIRGEQACRRGDIRLTQHDAQVLRAEHQRRGEVQKKYMPLNVVAVELGVPVLTIETLVRRGVLQLAEQEATGRLRLVTRASVAAYAEQRTPPLTPPSPECPAVSDDCARRITGLTRPSLSSMVLAGVFVAVTRERRRYITEESIEAWASSAGLTDVLARLTRVQKENQANQAALQAQSQLHLAVS